MSHRVTIRLSPGLARAAKKAAAAKGLSIGEWLRELAETETGVKAEMLQGFAALSEAKRRRTSRDAAKARWKPEEKK